MVNNDIASHHGHVPVMRDRMADLLRPAVERFGSRAVIVDGTLGAGGHTEHFLTVFPNASVVGIDRDEAALEAATERLSVFGERFVPVHGRFDCLAEEFSNNANPVFEAAREVGLAGAFFDLGVSSMQLDQTDRGFAYSVDAPLDMRMDRSTGLTAAEVLNSYSHGDLARVLKNYGDERFAGKIASAVIAEREHEPFDRSGRLVELLYREIPAATRRTGGHPAKRTFQALRVEVNRELEALENVLPMVADTLAPGGRAVFMSYQSLEDKLVKKAFAEWTSSKTPHGLPTELPGMQARFRAVTHGAEKATDDEIEQNRRAAPVRVRAVEKLDDPPDL